MTPEQKQSIQEVVDLFDLAERKVKEVEQLSQELSVPSINELKYVGYHLARAFCADDTAELSRQISKGKGHCQRAIYDAHEVGIIYLLERIRAFKERYPKRSHLIAEAIDDYIDKLEIADQAAKLIANVNEGPADSRGATMKIVKSLIRV